MTELPTLPVDNWRDQALNESMRRTSQDGSSVGFLIQEIRRRRQGCAITVMNLDRLQMVRFMEKATSHWQSVVPGSVSAHRHGQFLPYVGWYTAVWEGEAIELIALTQFNLTLCVADDEALLQRFSRSLSSFADRPAERCLRYTAGWENAPDLDAEIGKITWDDIVLPPEMVNGLRDAVEGFWRHRSAFTTLGFVWRRGILLVGPPGTGKTMVCKAAAAALPELPFLYVRDLKDSRLGEAIRIIFMRARKISPCILAFEDIDSLAVEANRTVFLNELDGFENNEGILVIASSNHPGRIDEALLKRPSRFDRVFHLGLPALKERREFCRRLLSRSALTESLAPSFDVEPLIERVASSTDGFTPAYLKELFLSAALQRAQEGVVVLDEKFAALAIAQIEELRQHLRKMNDPDALAEMRGPESSIGFRRRVSTPDPTPEPGVHPGIESAIESDIRTEPGIE